MKKLLSVILAVAMIMSLFCMVPASAENINTWPYFFEDFEDGVSSVGSVSEMTTVTGEGSAKSAKFVGTSTGYTDISLQAFRGWLRTGDTIKFSADLKLEQAITNNGLGIFMHYNGTTGYAETLNTTFEKNGYVQLDGSYSGNTPLYAYISDVTSTAWQKVNYEGVYTGADVYVGEKVNPSLRIFIKSDEIAYLDNIQLVVGKTDDKKHETSPVNSEKNIITAGGTESWGDIKITSSNYTQESSREKLVIEGTEEDPAPEGSNYLRFVQENNSSSAPYITIPLQENMKYGHTYKLTYSWRATFDSSWNANGASGDYQYVTHRIRYPHNSGSHRGMDNRWTGDKTYTHTGYDDWQTFDYYFIYNDVNCIENVTTVPYVQVGLWCYYSNGRIGATYDLDNIQFIDMGAVTNGGFDSKIDVANEVAFNVKESYTEGQVISEMSSNLTLGWQFDGTVSNSNGKDVRYALVQGGGMHSGSANGNVYGIIYGKQSETGNMYQYVPMEYAQKATIGAWIRPTKTGSVTNVGEHRIRLVLDYSGETAENEVYDVLTGTDNGKIYGDWVTVAATQADNTVWYNPTITVDNIFPLIDGKTATEGIIPKAPKLYIEFDYEGVVNTANHAVYADDFSITYEGNSFAPTVTASAATAAGGIVTVAQNTTAPENVTVSTVTKLTATKDGVKSYIASSTSTVITVPESYQIGYTLAAEITPIASNGYIGKTVTIEVPAVPVVVGTTFTATADDGATLTSDAETTGTVIWVAYDINGKMLGWSSAPISVTAGGTQTVPVPADFDATGADEVKVMLWADMTACKPLADHIAY